MRNRAKCRLCSSIIESLTLNDNVFCNCNEISVSGGDQYFQCAAGDFKNFIRIDDEDNEIEVKVIEKQEEKPRLTRQDFIDNLSEMIKNIENLPPQAMLTSINHYDYCALLILLHSIFVLENPGADKEGNPPN